jgi:follistatin-related protein 5
MSDCLTKEPTCSADDYAIMKDNLLLYHHQNMVYLQHGPDAPVHRMDYLVSIIFSHYDQNNDGLVERDELALMWSTMDMHHVANDSNCTLLDLLTYDDMNSDYVLTINEFNDAFHRISETRTVESTVERNVPSAHLDLSLTLNHLEVHVGDNVEIKCDISGASSPGVIWKRFGFDLSQISNDTDDYDDECDINDEIKLTPDGGLYIKNVQTKHAGNYTCQMSTNGMIVQTHVLNVHGSIPRNIILIDLSTVLPFQPKQLFLYHPKCNLNDQESRLKSFAYPSGNLSLLSIGQRTKRPSMIRLKANSGFSVMELR